MFGYFSTKPHIIVCTNPHKHQGWGYKFTHMNTVYETEVRLISASTREELQVQEIRVRHLFGFRRILNE